MQNLLIAKIVQRKIVQQNAQLIAQKKNVPLGNVNKKKPPAPGGFFYLLGVSICERDTADTTDTADTADT
ncbi:MAG: hypothetical protein M3N14_04635, partial [Bacteroidota bacterium]|nr:hypothetical protein [Bacteroidota bacterium]